MTWRGWAGSWLGSWGGSWGEDVEVEEFLPTGGGPDASDSGSYDGLDETEREKAHQESFERFKKVAYPQPVAVPVATPVTEKQADVFSNPSVKPASPDAALSVLIPKQATPHVLAAVAPVDPSIQRRRDEDALLFILLEA